MATFFLWIILFMLCWPIAIIAILLYPIVWLLFLPLRLIGISVNVIFELLDTLMKLPSRILKGPSPVK